MNSISAQSRLLADTTVDQLARVEEACSAINRMPDPLSLVLRMAITGSSAAHIAKATGLSVGHVELLRTAFVRHLDKSSGKIW